MGFLNLSEILQYVCGLEIAQYSGSEDLLELRLAGDWVVRRDASKEQRVQALERIVAEETGLDIAFEKRRVHAPVVRATGIFQYQPLPGALYRNDVQLFAERSVEGRGARTGRGSGTLAQLLRHITNRIARRDARARACEQAGLQFGHDNRLGQTRHPTCDTPGRGRSAQVTPPARAAAQNCRSKDVVRCESPHRTWTRISSVQRHEARPPSLQALRLLLRRIPLCGRGP